MRFKFSFGLIFWMVTLIVFPQSLTARDKPGVINDLVLEGKLHYGFLQPHHKSMRYLIEENATGVELSLSSHSYGRHQWEALYRYPRFGVAYLGLNLGNKVQMGQAHCLYGFLDLPIYRGKKAFSINYQIDFGAAYMTKIFDVETNPLNLAVASHFNMMVGLDFSAAYKLNDKNEVRAGFDLTHFSNGKIESPNKGYNFFTLNLAYLYTIRNKKYEQVAFETKAINKKHFLDLTLNAGLKTDDMISGNRYFISTFVADYWYAFSDKYLTGGGLDFFYDPSVPPTKEFELGEKANSSDAYQAGAHISISSRYNRLHVMLHIGTYLYVNYTKYSTMYSRFGFRYLLTDHLFFNFTLKSHIAIADYIEWGIGIRL